MMVFLLNESHVFPDPALADEDGLLAVGGDLSAERLVLAYRSGIFPWYSEGEPIHWYSPHERFVIFPDEVHISHTMKQLIRSDKYQVTWDKDFAHVITNCAKVKRKGQRGTWITDDMIRAYTELHNRGIAHSVEVWQGDTLAGGLYGVEIGQVFCGESMFSTGPNASKLALIHLCQSGKYKLIDCQLHNPHLERMGGRYISRSEYTGILKS
jgi:leucyl/phenylalanyl-tRNA--protein transferase